MMMTVNLLVVIDEVAERKKSAPYRRDDLAHPLPGMVHSLTGVDQVIRLFPFDRIRNLLGEDRLERFFGHAGPRHDTGTLDLSWCGDDDDLIEMFFPAPLEQQRDIDHGHAVSGLSCVFQKGGAILSDKGMDDRFDFL